MQMADRMAKRVGTLVVDTGPLLQNVQSMCPEHEVKGHRSICRPKQNHDEGRSTSEENNLYSPPS